ncbi:hypothetical protein V1514DRAFT_368733 [Lipomyces japonicus]|uniref:uncharacterized protein n=1 Tax=Lipomyces japonicus TaxID=56871 RepID=UPI0034CFE032
MSATAGTSNITSHIIGGGGSPGGDGKKRKRNDKEPRSRDGCQTCRTRHKRCDQRWPTCENCEKMKIKCEGYNLVLRWQDRAARTVQIPDTFYPSVTYVNISFANFHDDMRQLMEMYSLYDVLDFQESSLRQYEQQQHQPQHQPQQQQQEQLMHDRALPFWQHTIGNPETSHTFQQQSQPLEPEPQQEPQQYYLRQQYQHQLAHHPLPLPGGFDVRAWDHRGSVRAMPTTEPLYFDQYSLPSMQLQLDPYYHQQQQNTSPPGMAQLQYDPQQQEQQQEQQYQRYQNHYYQQQQQPKSPQPEYYPPG